MTKKETTNIPEIGIAEISDYVPSPEEEQKIMKFEKQAEKDINKKKQSVNVNFRWSEFEIARAKKNCSKNGYSLSNLLENDLKTSNG